MAVYQEGRFRSLRQLLHKMQRIQKLPGSVGDHRGYEASNRGFTAQTPTDPAHPHPTARPDHPLRPAERSPP